jgi:pimeloyl-ACP methyl ester carboxylesterase
MVEAHLGEALSSVQTRALTAQALQHCHDRWVAAGVDLAAYNSVESAEDVAAVMKALGFDRFDLYGLSYGALLAQHVLRDFPQAVRSITLDTSPVLIPSKHPTTGAQVMWPLAGQELLAEAREYTFRCTEAGGSSLEDVSWEEFYPPLRSFFTAVLSDIRDVCTAWDLEPVDAPALEPVKSDTPALLMAGQFDITTPPPLAMEVQHVVLGECALNMLGAFLEDPSTKPDDTCVKELKLSFVTP